MIISFSAQHRGWLHHVEKIKETRMLFNVSGFSYQITTWPLWISQADSDIGNRATLISAIKCQLVQPNFSIFLLVPTGDNKFLVVPADSDFDGLGKFCIIPKVAKRVEKDKTGKGRGQRLNFTNWLVDPTDWHRVTLDPITDSKSYRTKLANNNNTLVKNRSNQFINNQVKTMGIANPRIIQQQISRN